MQLAARSEDAFARLLRLCRDAGLPEVVEGTSYGAPALRARGKAFVSIKAEDCMVLHCGHEHKEFLLEAAPEIYWQTDHFRGWPGLMVRLAVISDEELQGRLIEAWRLRAPKKLIAEYDGKRTS